MVASIPYDCTCLYSTALAAAEVAAHNTDSPVYSLSRQTAVPSAKHQLFAFDLLLINYLAEYVYNVRPITQSNWKFGTQIKYLVQP